MRRRNHRIRIKSTSRLVIENLLGTLLIDLFVALLIIAFGAALWIVTP